MTDHRPHFTWPASSPSSGSHATAVLQRQSPPNVAAPMCDAPYKSGSAPRAGDGDLGTGAPAHLTAAESALEANALDAAPLTADTQYMAQRPVSKISDQVRDAITAAGKAGCSRYSISKATGIDQSVLTKFMAGERGLSMETLDELGKFLGLEIVVRKPPKT